MFDAIIGAIVISITALVAYQLGKDAGYEEARTGRRRRYAGQFP